MYKLAWKYWGHIDSAPNNLRSSLILYHLEHYINGAIMQNARIQRTRKNIDKNLREEMGSVKNAPYASRSRRWDFSLLRLYCDYHFYFDCIGQINKLLKRLNKELPSSELKNIHTKFTEIFGEDIDLRDALEHIDERAISEKRGRPIVPISDWGNFAGELFSFAGRGHAVNKQQLNKLTQIYEEIIDVLHKNCATKNQEFVLREQMEQRARQSKSLLRYLKKTGII
ncbi:MAG: hypothetical protein MUO97_01510 [Dehalococcoidia bacterium]|nr:hypothetical protein [Dehalococcoidia bacterium]